jgi:hypothetical protein
LKKKKWWKKTCKTEVRSPSSRQRRSHGLKPIDKGGRAKEGDPTSSLLLASNGDLLALAVRAVFLVPWPRVGKPIWWRIPR